MGSRCPQQSENSISATRGEKPSRYDQSHEKRRPGAQPNLLFCPSWAETANFAGQTTKTQPIERCALNNAAKPNRPLGAIAAWASPTGYATHSSAQPNPTGRTAQSIMQLSPTKHTAQPTPHSSPTARAAPPATRLARRHRPHAPEPHAHRATDEYPGPSSARSRASPSRARGTHRRALARPPRPRRPAAPRTPARAHASSR